jgi:NitT/TauT family transport system substrate-binding protein
MGRATSIVLSFLIALTLSFSFAPQAAAKADEILVAMDWIILGQHIPYFVALDKGFYADQNLAVTISRGYGSGDTVKRIAAKQATFGFADSGTLVAAIANDRVPVKMVAAIYGKAAPAIIYNAKHGISTPRDLEGKSIAASAGSATPKLFPAFAKANGIDPSKVKWVYVEPSAVNSLFAAGKVDAVALFVLEVPLLMNLTKDSPDVQVAYMSYADHGLNFYGNALIANDDTIKSNPDLVRRFVAATIKGYDYAINHLDEAVAIFGKYQREPAAAQAKEELELVKDLVLSPEAKARGIGAVDPKKAQTTIDLVTSGLELKRKISPQELYTAQFLPKR